MPTTLHIAEDVLAVLRAATVTEDRLVLPPGQLDRKLYEQVNKALEQLGGQWNRKAKAHLFAEDPRAKVAQLTDTGAVERVLTQKHVFQEFWTPEPLADQMVAMAEVRPGDAVCDPSAGTGRLLQAVLRVPGFVPHEVNRLVAWEIQPARADALRHRYPTALVVCRDFLREEVQPQRFDAIVMNPPFTKSQALQHVTHALPFLKQQGRLVAVMPSSLEYGTDKATRALQDLLTTYQATITPLPEQTFQASGTDVHTVLVRCVRPPQPAGHAVAPDVLARPTPHHQLTLF